MSDFDEEMLGDFLVEGWEQIETLDQEFVKLEADAEDLDRVEGIFRVMHTLKGGAGFLSLPKLESVTHHAESLLSLVWQGQIPVDQPLVDLLLECADTVKSILASLEADKNEGSVEVEPVIARLMKAAEAEPPGDAEEAEQVEEMAEQVGEVAEEPSEDSLVESEALLEMEALQAELMMALEQPVAKTDVAAPDELGARQAAEVHRQPMSKQIRVKVELLDKLMNLVGELVLSRNQLLQLASKTQDSGMEVACQRINLVTSELQDNILQARMQPIDTILKRFPRLVRDLATQTGKEVRLTLEGEETGLDRTILEAIKDPLTHILRNSIDHGLETPEERRAAGKSEHGTIHIRAFHEGGQVTIEFIDNGRGVDLARVRDRAVARGLITLEESQHMPEREVLNLLFHPGFSTAEKVTNLSGRGVGMDVVKTSTEAIGGTIDLQSTPGQGTIVRLKLPLTLAIVPALIVCCDEQRYAIPQVSLQEMVRLSSEAKIERLYGGEVYRLRGELLPLLRLRKALGLAESNSDSDEVNIVVMRSDDLAFGLIVDDVLDTEEIVVKPLSRELKNLKRYAGATIMGDGRIALILDVAGLASTARLATEEKRHFRQGQVLNKEGERQPGQPLLLFKLQGQCHAIPLSLVSRLEEISSSCLEMISGRPMVHYRGRLLPLIDLSYELGQGTSLESQTLQVLVFRNGQRYLGLAVDAILDVVEQTQPVQRTSAMPGLVGTTIIDEKAVALVDVPRVITCALPEWLENSAEDVSGSELLLVGVNSLTSSFVRSHLQTAGHQVSFADSIPDAAQCLERGGYELLILDLEFEQAPELLHTVQETFPGMTVLGLNHSDSFELDGAELPHLFRGSPDELLETIESLLATIPKRGVAA